MKKTIINTLQETALLNRYLKSRGVNPEFVSKDQKVAHSKTNQFKAWMRDHMNDTVRESITTEPSPTQKRLRVLKKSIRKHQEVRVPDGEKKLHSEAVDKKDTITFDIPLLIRVLEFAREELKSDVNLHKMVERLISMRGKGTLTMNQYGRIVKEEVETERLDEISAELQHRYFKAANAQKKDSSTPKATKLQRRAGMNKVISRTLKRNTLDTPGAAQDFKDQEKKRGVGHVRDHVEVEGNVLESKEANYGGDYQASVKAVKAKAEKNPVDVKSLADRMQAAYRRENEKDEQGKTVKEGVVGAAKRVWKAISDFDSMSPKYDGNTKRRQALKDKLKKNPVKENMEPQAADAQPCDCANNPDDTLPAKRSSKLKLLLGGKKGQVKEEMYDHEKEDKSTAPLRKKTKFEQPGMDPTTKQSPPAAAILSGGKTLTGEPRDTIEIDPMMKMRKQSPDSQKSV